MPAGGVKALPADNLKEQSMKKWFSDAVFYEIYPQTFFDSDGDGIGDFNGITAKLDYIKSLGCNAIWMNPCFDSPFKDAGYDVRDYKKPAGRYGTEADLVRLFNEVHARGMHIILDLVPGHTSEEHEWFKESKKVGRNEFSDRYIWTDFWLSNADGLNFVAGEAQRSGVYVTNFFKCQPALNYGFLNPKEKWQKPLEDPECIKTRDAIVDIILFWLSKGADGFRVDMADSLVKHDDGHKSGTIKVWQYIFDKIRKQFPDAFFVSEWGRPNESSEAGFDSDFLLDWAGNPYNALVRDYECHSDGTDNSFFKQRNAGGSVAAGTGDSSRAESLDRFLNAYLDWYEATKDKSFISLITGNHDTPRLKNSLTDEEIKLYIVFIMTMPGIPFIYYGDEIGMRYMADLPTKEGGYTRTGTRTPMQWDDTENAGFSSGEKSAVYIPLDPGYKSINVKIQEDDRDSLLNFVRKMTAFRQQTQELRDNGNFEVISRDPLVYRRGSIITGINPSGTDKTVNIGTARVTIPAGSYLIQKEQS